jgi:rhamnopyranosyl-N-acetylglucosaminyl-diphospho-decaprenol beta-1,3/1,4-galactofuranosyltransferase
MKSFKTSPQVKAAVSFIHKDRSADIVAIVVTYNRKDMLRRCIDLLLNQTASSDVLIVDNASTDGTEDSLLSCGLLDNHKVHYIKLSENTGGAGGFHYGLKYAYERGWCWFWIMDDDAEPHNDALEKLVGHPVDGNNIYGSAAVAHLNGEIKLCFPMKIIHSNAKIFFIEDYSRINNIENVVWLPFLGLFIHRNVIEKIRLPDRELFIRNDDVEYSERAKSNGMKIFLIKESVIEHPLQPTIPFVILGRQLYYKSTPPWKMYYEVRNKIIIAKRYYPFLSALRSISGVTLLIFLSILFEKNKMGYLNAYLKGIKDGILKR